MKLYLLLLSLIPTLALAQTEQTTGEARVLNYTCQFPKPEGLQYGLEDFNDSWLDKKHDDGFTHGLDFFLSAPISKKERLTFKVSSHLYTREAKAHRDPFDDHLWETIKAAGIPLPVDITNGLYSLWGKNLNLKEGDTLPDPAYFLDATKFKAQYEHYGRYHVRGALTMEVRSTEPGKSFMWGVPVREGFHKLTHADAYHVSSKGEQEELVSYQNQTLVYKAGFAPQPDLEQVSRVSVGTEVGVARDWQALKGFCRLETEGSASIAVDGNGIDPNSTVTTSVEASKDILHTRSGSPRLSFTVGGDLNYFPASGPGTSKALGANGRITVLSFHKLGSKGQITPFLRITIPSGRQQFDFINDHNVIQQFGFIVKKRRK